MTTQHDQNPSAPIDAEVLELRMRLQAHQQLTDCLMTAGLAALQTFIQQFMRCIAGSEPPTPPPGEQWNPGHRQRCPRS